MMLRKAGLALAVVMLITQAAAAQPLALGQPEKIPLPTTPGMPNGEPLLVLDGGPRVPWLSADADYLLWWIHRGPAPILLTTAPNNGLNQNGLTGGILGEPGTRVLFDGHDLNFHALSGGRAKIGVNLGQDGFWSFELGAFFLQRKAVNFAIGSNADGTPLLTMPFLDAATGQPSTLDISAQDADFLPYLAGGFNVHADTRLWGYEANLIAHSIRTPERSIDLLFGFRSVGLDENLYINQTIIPANDGNVSLQFPTAGQGVNFYYVVPQGGIVRVNDTITARNTFYGAQIGGRFIWEFGPVSVDLLGKVAFGVTNQAVTLSGVSTATEGINPITQAVHTNLITPGGVYALQNNSGRFTQNPFSVVPELGLNLNWAVFPWMDLRIGYSGTYWSNVARPGSQIDTTLNSKLVPTGAVIINQNKLPPPPAPGAFSPTEEQGRPYFVFRDSAFWAHGINVGVLFRY